MLATYQLLLLAMKAHSLRLPLALVVVISLFLSNPLHAALTGYLKIGDIDGESQDIGYEGYIEVQSLSWGVVREDSDRRSLATFTDLAISKPVDRATPKLFEACAMGIVIAECELTLVRSYSTGVQQPYLRITLKNVIVTSTSLDVPNPSADERLTETLTLSFEEVEMEYFVRSATGSLQGVVKMTYNRQTATP